MPDSSPELHVLAAPGHAVAELLAAQARRGGSIVLTGGSSVADAYREAAALEPDWSAVDGLVGRRALRAAGGRALELPPREGEPARPVAAAAARDPPHSRRAPARRRRGRARPGARRRPVRPDVARARPRRPHGLALPRLAAAGRSRPPGRVRPGRPRAVGRPRDDDVADDQRRREDRLPRHRRRQGRRRLARFRGRDLR